MDCCDVYADQFDRESAVDAAQRYREKGLTGSARHMVDALSALDIDGFRVLDIGGGVGAVGLELVKAGAESALNVELSSSYRHAATALAVEHGLEDRVEMTVADAADPSETGTADIVVMNRVVCCYPDGDVLMDSAISRAERYLALSYPTPHWGSKAVIGFENRMRRRRGSDFRTFVHPAETVGRPAAAGFRAIYRRSRPVWSVRVWEAGDVARAASS
jgi:SAM-dependent methyltransferase